MSNTATNPVILEDIYDVKDMDPEGKKFDKVSRLICTSENFEMDLVLDINTDIYPVEIGERLTIALARTLDLEGRPDDGRFDLSLYTEDKPTLMDQYEYVMYGRVYNYKPEKQGNKVSIYVSFGGLLMRLSGDPQNIDLIYPSEEESKQQKDADVHLYMLIRK